MIISYKKIIICLVKVLLKLFLLFKKFFFKIISDKKIIKMLFKLPKLLIYMCLLAILTKFTISTPIKNLDLSASNQIELLIDNINKDFNSLEELINLKKKKKLIESNFFKSNNNFKYINDLSISKRNSFNIRHSSGIGGILSKIKNNGR